VWASVVTVQLPIVSGERLEIAALNSTPSSSFESTHDADDPATLTVIVRVWPATRPSTARRASTPRPSNRSCTFPAGSPGSVKRPEPSVVAATELPTTLIVRPDIAAAPTAPGAPLDCTLPATVAPAEAAAGAGAAFGLVTDPERPQPAAVRITEDATSERNVHFRMFAMEHPFPEMERIDRARRRPDAHAIREPWPLTTSRLPDRDCVGNACATRAGGSFGGVNLSRHCDREHSAARRLALSEPADAPTGLAQPHS
jgi:hypothetical protein